MFEQGDSFIRQKMNDCSFQQLLRQNLSRCLSKHRGFIFKPTERAYRFSKHGTRDSQNSPPFERSARFYVTITGNFERFETNFLKNKNVFQKTRGPFFSCKYKD